MLQSYMYLGYLLCSIKLEFHFNQKIEQTYNYFSYTINSLSIHITHDNMA